MWQMWQNVTPMILLPYMGKGASQVAQWWKIRLPMQERETQGCKGSGVSSIPGSGRNEMSRKWQLTPVFLPGEFLGQRSLVGYSPWGCKVRHVWAHTHLYGKGDGVALTWLFKTQSYYSTYAQISAASSLSLVSKKTSY